MLRALMIAGLLVVGAAPSCSGPDKPVKSAKSKDKQKQKDARALLAEARSSAASGELDAADKAYQQAYQTSQEFDILEERVDFLIHAGKATRAQETAKAYYEEKATDIKGYLLYAEALLAGTNGKDALKVAEEILGLKADEPGGFEKKGRALILMERPDEGFEALRKAVQLDPENVSYRISLGRALYDAKKVDAAALEFRAAIKAAPDDAKAYVYLGMALRDQDELEESKEKLDKALELDANNGRAYFELGLLYNKQGKQADAEQALSKAVQKSPNESLFWYAYGEIYRLQERTEDAISAYRKAINLDPPYPKAITKLGVVLVDRKEYDDAEKVLLVGVRREEKNAANYLALGDLYAAKRKPKDAVFYYEKYLQYAPRNDKERARVKEALPGLKRKGR
jgi:superkiller protein 3